MIPQTIKKLDDNLFSNGNKIFINDDFNARIFRNETGILYTDINNIILDDVNFDKGDPETIIHVKLWLGVVDLNSVKQLNMI